MNTQYEAFNEKLFESYCKVSIDNAILKERKRKAARSKWEVSLPSLTEATLYALTEQDDRETDQEETFQVFSVHGIDIPVFNKRLAVAISYLLPREREIILLYYFLGMKDERIAQSEGMTLPTVNRRRKAAKEKLRIFLEDEE